MRYNPREKTEGTGGGRAEPGEYPFHIEDAVELTFKSGTEGCKLTLQVGAFQDREIKVFDNLMYLPQSLFRTENLLQALGFDFNNPPEVHHLIGKTGRAKFVIDKESGYLKVQTYIVPKAPSAAQAGLPRVTPQPRSAPARAPAAAQRPLPRGKQPGDDEPPPFMDDVPF